MKVVYSIGVCLNGGGIGNIAYNAVEEIYRKKYLEKAICQEYTPGKIPSKKVIELKFLKFLSRYPLRFIEKYLFKNFKSYYHIGQIYGFFSSKKISECKIFHSWRGSGIRPMEKAKKLGAKTIIVNASSHPKMQKKLLEEEYAKYGLSFKPYSKQQLKTAIVEIDKADYIEVPSDFVEKSFIEEGVPREKLIKIPFGVDLNKYSGKKNKKDGKFRAVFVGSVMIRKGIQYLLQAWDELKLENSELIIVGNICSDAKKIVEKYKGNKTIKFTGFDDPKKYYAISDVFVFPSIEEGSALVTYEAMASGLPLIVTFNTGSVAREGKEGFILPIRDVVKLKEKIKFMYDNPKICEEMGKNARKHVENFPWENYGKKILEVYGRILNE